MELHRFAGGCRLSSVVGRIHENAHPLFACAMRIDAATPLTGALDFYPMFSGVDSVIGVDPSLNKVGVAIKVRILDERSRMLSEACCEHIRYNA